MRRKLSRREFLYLSAVAGGGAALAGAAGHAHGAALAVGSRGKKLIEYGWDVPGAEFVRDNVRAMEGRPFDGIVFNIKGVRNDPEGYPNDDDIPRAFDTRRWRESEMKLDVLRSIRWGRFTDNFLILWGTNDRGMDWFDDTHWDTIAANMLLYARAARTGRCVGIVLDPEPYGESPWEYGIQRFPGKSFARVEARVRERGARFISALQRGLPRVRLLTFWGLGIVRAQTEYANGNIQETQYALLRAFIEGMLGRAAGNASIIDGNEGAYYYDETLKFFDGLAYIRGSSSYVSPENRASFARHYRVANALYPDYVFGLWPEFDRGWSQGYKQRWWEHNVYHALATSNRYAWCYSEKPDWWRGDVPSGVEGGIRSARRKLSRGEALGFDLVKKAGYWDATRQAAITRSPGVRLTRPSDGARFAAPATISLAAAVTGTNVSRVAFYRNTHKVGEVTSAPFRITVKNVPAGRHDFTAIVFDNRRAHGTSAPVRVAVQR